MRGSKNIELVIFIILLTSIYGCVHAQQVKGKISTEGGLKLEGAVVNVLYERDSIFHSFTRTNEEGFFSIPLPKDTGEYLLVFLYPKHTDVALPLEVGIDREDFDLGALPERKTTSKPTNDIKHTFHLCHSSNLIILSQV